MAALAVLVLAACSRHSVSLSNTNARGEVPVLTNLQFSFSSALVPDSLQHRWDSTAYIRFSPEIPGRFRWESASELVFSPAAPLQPATTYRFTFAEKELLRYSDLKSVKGSGDNSFRSHDLRLESEYITWTKAEGGIQARAELHFNYPVAPDALQKALQISLNQQAASLQMLTLNTAPVHTVLLQGVAVQDKDYEVSISLAKGLVPAGGKNGLPEAQQLTIPLASPYVLQVADVEAEHTGTGGSIFVRTNQPIATQAMANLVRIEPNVRFTATPADNGLIISSDAFSTAAAYQLTLGAGLAGTLGGTLKEAYQASVTFGEMEPSLRFANSKAVYLSAAGERNLELQVFGVPRIKLIVSRVYENNLLAAHRYGYYPREKNDTEGDDYYDWYGGSDYAMGDVLLEQEIDTRTLPKHGSGRLLQFNPQERLPGYKGIYHIMVRSTSEYWMSDSRYIALSDIGLIAKAGAQKMLVWAHSLQGASSMSGVGLQVYGVNNQLIGTGSTNATGLAEINLEGQQGGEGFAPAMVVARLGDDFTYLPLASTKVNHSRYAIGGKKANASGLDAMLVPERDLYRPGETIRLGLILRDAARKVPAPQPLRLQLLMPNGKVLAQQRLNTTAEGLAETSIPVPESAPTGSYTLELYNGSEVLLSTYSYKVEEFVPDRIKVTAALSTDKLQPGQQVQLRVEAANYYGPPAANRKYEIDLQMRQQNFAPSGFDNYDFALSNLRSFFDNQYRQGATGAEGTFQENFEIPALYANMGLMQARFFTTVFDENGRPVSRLTTAPVQTQPVLLGLGNKGSQYAALNQANSFPLVALSPAAKPVSSTALVQVVKHTYRTVLQRTGSYFRYDSQKEESMVQEQRVSIGTQGASFAFTPREPGEYELRLSLPGAPTYVSRRIYCYGAWGGMASFEVNADGQVDIAADKTGYSKGDKAKLLFKAPFDGKMLVTLESHEVLHQELVEVKNRTASLEIALTEAHLPNVYVTATLFKPHRSGSNLPLTAAHGLANLTVSDNSKRLEVKVKAVAQSRSGVRQRIAVQAQPGSMVNLAAVDNGILAISRFATPNPYSWYFGKRALSVQAWDMYPLLFPELRRISSTGGDAAASFDMRQNPVVSKRFTLMSYWSGWQKVGSNGEAAFDVAIPNYNGEIRLMAVAVQGDKFGATESTLKVADPLVVSTAMPRFMSPGDTVQAAITIANTTDKEAQVQVQVQLRGPLQATGSPAPLRIPARSEGRVAVPLAALTSTGAANLQVLVTGLGETFRENIDIAVRPASGLQRRTGAGVLAAGKSQSLRLPISDLTQYGYEARLVVGRSPVLQLAAPLQYLVNYPHGCTEQVVSAAFPMLYAADLGALLRQDVYGQPAQAGIAQAMQKLKLRQLYNGGLTLWDGHDHDHWWTTAYAAHFLIEARKAGYAPDAQLLESMLQYLTQKLRRRELIPYTYNRTEQKKIAPKEVAYSLYVLALAGRLSTATMNYYKANTQLLALDSRYVLAATYALAGDQKGFAALLPASFAGEQSVPVPGGSLHSPLRDEALALNVLLEVNPAHPQVGVMAKHVVDQLNAAAGYSTQEAVFGLLALGKMARAEKDNAATAEVWVGGKKTATFSGNTLTLSKAQLGSGQLELKAAGKGRVYYWWEASGISATGTVVQQDNYLKVRRQLFDRSGRELSGNVYKQNDLIVVKLTLEKTFTGAVENVVVTDLLPGGWEVENPRIRELPGMDWARDESQPLSRDIRDDRIHFFTDLTGSKQVFYYAVRAVTPGSYQAGPLSADAMYQPEYHSYSGVGRVVVRAAQVD